MSDAPEPRDVNAYLRSLIRMEIRKRERALARLARRPSQSDTEFEDFRRRQVEALDFRRAVLAALEADHEAEKTARAAARTIQSDALRAVLRRSRVGTGDELAMSDALGDIERTARNALDATAEPRG